MTTCLHVDVDGSVTEYDGTPSVIASALLVTPDPWSAPTLTRAFGASSTIIVWCEEWGRRDLLPVNVKAWMVYGGSAIVGPAIVSLDDGGHLPDALIAALTEPPQTLYERAMQGLGETGYPDAATFFGTLANMARSEALILGPTLAAYR